MVDLRDRGATLALLRAEAPDAVIHAAAVVGGIEAKLADPTPFLLDNLLIDSSVLDACRTLAVESLLYVSSGAVYPEGLLDPIPETALLSGPLEAANEGYALSKIVGSRVCDLVSRSTGLVWRAVALSNLYGLEDSFDPGRAHLVAAALGKAERAAETSAATVEVWGDGLARREFTFADDVTDWLAYSAESWSDWPTLMNIGAGVDHSIADYYRMACAIAGFEGELAFDADRPSGTQRRLLDSTRARTLGWEPRTPIADGMAAVYAAHRRSIDQKETSS